MIFVVGVLSMITGALLWAILSVKLSGTWQDGLGNVVGMWFCIFLMMIIIMRTFSALGFDVSASEHSCYQTYQGLVCD